MLPTDKQNITVKLGIPNPQTLERLEIQNATLKRMLLFRTEHESELSLQSGHFPKTTGKFPTLAHFALSYGPSATSNTSLPSFQIRRQFYTLITQYIHGNKELREERTERIYFECNRPNTSLIYVTQLPEINRRYHSAVHNAT